MIHWNTHTVYSYRRSLLTVEGLADAVKSQGETTMCVTDVNSLTAAIKANLTAMRLGLKCVVGMDTSVRPDASESTWVVEGRQADINRLLRLKRTTDEERVQLNKEAKALERAKTVRSYQQVLLAPNRDCLHHLMRLYKEQQVLPNDLALAEESKILEAGQAGMILLTGGHDGKIAALIRDGRIGDAERYLLSLKEAYADRMWVQLEWDADDRLVELAEKVHVPLVATNMIEFLTDDQRLDHRLFCNIFSDERITSFREHLHLPTEAEMLQWVTGELARSRMPQALENTHAVDASCELYNFTQAKPLVDMSEPLRQLCEDGWKRLRAGTEWEKASRERFEYELSIINMKGFSQYFLKVLDIVKVAHDLGIMIGPARGSGGGSEVCYLVGIMKVDPLKYHLYFERFMNPGRGLDPDPATGLIPIGGYSYPDIDMDYATLPGGINGVLYGMNHATTPC